MDREGEPGSRRDAAGACGAAGDLPGSTPARGRKPAWLKVRPVGGDDYHDVKRLLRRARLHTICEKGACPNRGECFSNRTATFLILGPVCTRACAFCHVDAGRPVALDAGEPRRLAEAVAELKLRFAVVTSVTRDDLPDGGAAHFAATIEALRQRAPGCGVEVLVPDFQGEPAAIARVLAAAPDVFAHNLETVPRLYAAVRPQADYHRSLRVLRQARAWAGASSQRRVKTGVMVGLGETRDEVLAVMQDCAAAGLDIFTLGQYLQPSPAHHPVARWWSPDEFSDLARAGRALGLKWVEAGPLVRSSYHAGAQAAGLAEAEARHGGARAAPGAGEDGA